MITLVHLKFFLGIVKFFNLSKWLDGPQA